MSKINQYTIPLFLTTLEQKTIKQKENNQIHINSTQNFTTKIHYTNLRKTTKTFRSLKNQ